MQSQNRIDTRAEEADKRIHNYIHYEMAKSGEPDDAKLPTQNGQRDRRIAH